MATDLENYRDAILGFDNVVRNADPDRWDQLAEAAMRAWSEAEAAGSPVRRPAILGDPIRSDSTDPLEALLAFTGRRHH